MWADVLADRSEGRQETLSMARGLEATHRSFPLTSWLMRVLAAVVEPTMATMLHTRHDILLGCLVAPELVRAQDTWHVLASFEQLAEELLCSRLVPPALHENIKHVAVLVDCPPEIGRLAVD